MYFTKIVMLLQLASISILNASSSDTPSNKIHNSDKDVKETKTKKITNEPESKNVFEGSNAEDQEKIKIEAKLSSDKTDQSEIRDSKAESTGQNINSSHIQRGRRSSFGELLNIIQ